MLLARPAGDVSALHLPLRLLLVLLVIHPIGVPVIRAGLLAVAVPGLVSQRVLEAPATWLTLTALLAVRLAAAWPLPDNHDYLEAYFCLAVALALTLPRSAHALGRACRLLVGLAFVFALLWKAGLSSDFTDGRFFRVTVLRDGRFDGVVRLLGGLDDHDIRENRSYLTPRVESGDAYEPGPLHEPPAVRGFATAATWGSILLEALVAASFLWPGSRFRPLRHASLLMFAVVTYALAPVPGFGWLVLTMGLCDTEPGESGLRRAYGAAFFVVLLFAEIPWAVVTR